jgi:hypothetical protein
MRNDTEVTIRVGTLKAMNAEQFLALKENVLADNMWENADSINLYMGDGALMVCPMNGAFSMIVIGIEKDGYTHS